ncbi:MAG: lipopolysaccharide export system permease protein [Chthoniobacter sp.]|nr:lipopolysaccharide export system permease protein [Chthoniobacter sp.]
MAGASKAFSGPLRHAAVTNDFSVCIACDFITVSRSVRILDRYVLKNFLVPFALCFLGFLAIWLVFDLSDNGPDFIEAHVAPVRVALFYATQLPQITVICLPVGLLLALLYSLSRMSRSNEIISMLTAGRSVVRILFPLILMGVLASFASLALNYKLGPHSEDAKRTLLEQITKGKDKTSSLEAQLFRNRANNRTWFVQTMKKNANDLHGVHIIQQDADGNITTKWYARRAVFEPMTRTWNFERGKTVNFDSEGNITGEDLWLEGSRKIENWSETPWRIASSNLEAQSLSVPELRDYLRFNADFPDAQLAPYRTHLQYRWALPWSCLVVIFIAAPLGIVYSRRGVLAGVASSIFIFFGMIFLTNLFLALGKGGRISATTAAWAPNVLFATVGFFLLYLRSTNRELPKFGFGGRRK